ncbi:MAG: glycosyltransferase [Bryobacteraceae bacterium]
MVKHPLLILAYYYPPDVESGAARPYRLAKYLQRLGHPVDVIAPGIYDKPVTEGIVHRVRGEREKHPRKDLPALIERGFRKLLFSHDPGITWVPRAVSYASRWARNGSRPVLLSTAPPATTHLAALWLKRRYGMPWIADFRDPMFGNPFRPRSQNVDARIEPFIFRHADAVIANTDTVAEMWKERYPQWKQKIHLLWNGFDPEEVLEARPIPPHHDQKVLSHVGVIYGERDPSPLLIAFDRLVSQGVLDPRKVRIQLVGPMMLKLEKEGTILQRLKSQGCLEIVNKRIPQAEAQQIITIADYLLLLDVTNQEKGLQVPAKLFEYIRIGRPVLACTIRHSPVDRILAQSGLPVVCLYSGDSGEEMGRKLASLFELPTEPVSPSDWFQTTFDGMNQAKFVSGLMGSL